MTNYNDNFHHKHVGPRPLRLLVSNFRQLVGEAHDPVRYPQQQEARTATWQFQGN